MASPPKKGEQYIDDLIRRMTLQEKAGQLSCFTDQIRLGMNAAAASDLLSGVRAGKVGALFNGIGAREGKEMQRVAVEESRLGIPLLLGGDVIHGLRTVFPIPLAEAASFEPELAERTARATALEAAAAGLHWTFAPMVDVARDQRWGRVAESSGEDPLLGQRFAAARVLGFQTEDLTAEDSLLACPKHLVAYGAVSAGLDYNFVDVSEATLRDVHFPPFQAAFKAGAITAMSAFNDVMGVPASANEWILSDVLRGEWSFPGFVVSDFEADRELIAHGYAEGERDAAKKALLAGVDMSMESGLYNEHVPELVESGEVPLAVLDERVRRVLRVKMAIGLFNNPYKALDPTKQKAALNKFSNVALAREAAKKSIVLLKNQGDLLPLRKSGQRIALIGPFASDTKNLEGCWALMGDKDLLVSIERGLREALAEPGFLTVVQGCAVEDGIEGGINAAVAAAKAADVVILAVGEPQKYSGEAQSRTQTTLPEAQRVLAEALAATGKPTVVLLKTGRALALPKAVQEASAILVTWFLGSRTGPAVADVVFGDYNPAGRLPVSFPQDGGQQPFFYNRPRTGRPPVEGQARYFKAHWREVSHEPLYPFGHGLSYTKFEYSLPVLSSSRMAWDEDGAISASAEVRNVGRLAGEEVVQLYVHDRVGSRVRPIRELKGFQKVLLQPGTSRTVTFTLSCSMLAFHGATGQQQAEPGTFDLWIAPSCTQGRAVSFELLAARPKL